MSIDIKKETFDVKYILVIFLLFIPFSAYAEKDEEPCSKSSIIVSDVSLSNFVSVVTKLKDCIKKRKSDELIDVYVTGTGGEVGAAMAFYDMMRTSGLNKKTRFIGLGYIMSASNLVWFASDVRVIYPSTSFLLHRAKLNMSGEDHATRTGDYEHLTGISTEGVRRAAGDSAAELWLQIVSGETQGRLLSGQEAIDLGWATEIIQYPSE